MLLGRLRKQWPACTYHLTRRNCLSFAEQFVGLLQITEPIPPWLTGIMGASSTKTVEAITDCSWSCAKWWMITKQEVVARQRTAQGLIENWTLAIQGGFERNSSNHNCDGAAELCKGTH